MEPYTLAQLAELTQSTLIGDPNHTITGVEELKCAGSADATFLENPRYKKQAQSSDAGVIFVHPSIELEGVNLLCHEYPSLAFQKVIELFLSAPLSGFADIHPTAVVHEQAKIGEKVSIDPNAVVDRGACIGAGSQIGAGAFVGAESIIGEQCVIHAKVVIREGCRVGNRVIIQPGAVIGCCGFGYFSDQKTGKHHPLKQLGTVVIEDDVEIGANTTIDRARFKTTRICRGTKIDNLVQIAHQVELGRDNLIVSQVGIAGSTKTGRNVVMGGQVGVIGHVTITDNVIIAAKAAVSKGINKSGIYSGLPAAPIKEFNTHFIQLRSIGKVIERLKKLEKQVASLVTPQEASG